MLAAVHVAGGGWHCPGHCPGLCLPTQPPAHVMPLVPLLLPRATRPAVRGLGPMGLVHPGWGTGPATCRPACPMPPWALAAAAQGHMAGAGLGPNGPGAPWLGGPDFVAGVANGHIVAPMPHSQPMHVGPCVAGGGRQGGRGGGWQCPVQPRAPPAHPTPCPMPSAPLSNARPNGGCAQGGGLPLAAPVAVPGWRLAAPVAAGWWRVAVGGCESKSTHTCGHRPTMVYRHA